MHKFSPKSRGFTLIELLVVVAIIAVLVSILLPALSYARETARQVACVSNMKQIGISIIYYMDSYNGFIVPSAISEGASQRPVDGPVWYDLLSAGKFLTFDYSDPKVLHCPSHIITDVYGHPANQFVSYGTNRFTCGFFSTSRSDWNVKKLESFGNSPSTVIMLGERGSVSEPITLPWSICGTNIYWWSGVLPGYGYGMDWTRHATNASFSKKGWFFNDGRAGILLADGSAKMYTASFACQPNPSPDPLLYNSPGSPFPTLYTSEP